MKKLFSILFLTGFISFLTSCTWQIPNSLSVKTDAVYNFSIGTITKEFNDHFNSEAILSETFASDSQSRIYDYFPGKENSKIQKFLMKIPIQDIPVNFTEYFNSTKLAESITDLSFNKTVSIPEINISVDEKVPTAAIFAGINAIVTGTGETPSTAVTYVSSFTSVKYKTGKMTVSCESPVSSGTAILKYKGSTIGSTTVRSGKAEFDLSGKTIYKTGMTLELPIGAGRFTMTVDSSSEIAEAKGVTLPTAIIVPFSTEVSNSNAAGDFSECVVGEGDIEMNVVLPEVWSGVAVEYDVDITGALATSAEATVGSRKVVPLANKTISNGKMTMGSNIALTLNNSTLDFASTPNLKAQTTITSYKSIGIVLTDVETSINQKEPISQEMKDMVERLVLNKSGLKGKYVNTFPAGNSIELKASSDFIGLSNASASLTSGTNDDDGTAFSLTSPSEKTVKFRTNPSAADEYSHMDFLVDVQLPGASASEPNKIKVVDVEAGKTYKLSFELEPDINWISITLFSSGVNETGFKDTGLNINQMFSSFSEVMGSEFDGKIELKALPIHIYSVKPSLDSFDKAKFIGEMNIQFGSVDENGVFTQLTQDKEELMKKGEDMPFAESPVLTMEEKTVVSTISNYPPSSTADIAVMCNNAKENKDGSIFIQYNLQFTNPGVSGSTFTVSYEDYKESNSNSSSIAIYAFLEIALDFQIDSKEDITINLLKLADKPLDKDILGRETEPTESERSNFLSAIRGIKINYESFDLPFYGIPAPSIRLDMDGPENNSFQEQTLDMTGGTFILSDHDSLLNVYPLIPEANVVLHAKGSAEGSKGQFSVPRDVKLTANIALCIEMDSNYEISIFSGKGGK